MIPELIPAGNINLRRTNRPLIWLLPSISGHILQVAMIAWPFPMHVERTLAYLNRLPKP